MRAKHVFAVVATAAVALSAVALAQPGKGPAVPKPPPAPEDRPDDSDLTADEKARRKQVIARVGDETITVGEVEDAINAQSPFLRARYRTPARRKEFVRNMIRFELLAREAKRRGFDENKAVVRSRKQNAVQELIRREFDEKITPQSIPEKKVRGYYESHPEEFSRPEMVRAAHILLPSEEKAEELLDKAQDADKRGFRQLAREHSIDTETKLRGGDLRYFTPEGRPPGSQDPPVDQALVDAAFSLEEVGDVVDEPVKVSDDGWSIVRRTGHRQAEKRSFEQAEKGIRMRLWRNKREEAIAQFVDKLRKRFDPKVYERRMKPIELDTSPDSPAKGFPSNSKAKDKTKGQGQGGEGKGKAPKKSSHSEGTGGAEPSPGTPAND
jgi:peptidyl-prolyl cis-trans isomerase C